MPKAVDELLRRFPIVNQGRLVVKDIELKGAPMKAGDMVLMPTTLHGLDERKFPISARGRLRPADADPQHVRQWAAPLSRARTSGRTELKIFLQEWLPRIPEFRHDPQGKVGMSSGVNATVYRLPLVWETH